MNLILKFCSLLLGNYAEHSCYLALLFKVINISEMRKKSFSELFKMFKTSWLLHCYSVFVAVSEGEPASAVSAKESEEPKSMEEDDDDLNLLSDDDVAKLSLSTVTAEENRGMVFSFGLFLISDFYPQVRSS